MAATLDCLFCKIIAGEIPAEILLRDGDVIAIRDIQPEAPTHILVMPIAHVPSVLAIEPSTVPVMGRLLQAAAELAERENLRQRGFRLIVNTGDDAGQTVGHLHVHLLGGRSLGPMLSGGKHG